MIEGQHRQGPGDRPVIGPVDPDANPAAWAAPGASPAAPRPERPPEVERAAGSEARARAQAADRPTAPPVRDRAAPWPGGPPPDTDRWTPTATGPPLRAEGQAIPTAGPAVAAGPGRLPAAPTPGAASAPAGPTTPGRRAVRLVALALVPVLAVVALVAALQDRSDDPPEADDEEAAGAPPSTAPAPTTTTPPTTDGPPPPSGNDPPPEPPPAEWRPEVVELVRFVQRERQLTFEHPVHVDLLTEQEYLHRRGGDDGSVGYYDGHRVVVRGDQLTPPVRGTLVHELTHALDDQHFDLSTTQGRADSPEAELAVSHLVEGDAVRMEWAYDETLIDAGEDPGEVYDQVHAAVGAPGVPLPGPPPAVPPTTGPPPTVGPPPTTGPEPGGTTTTTVDSYGQGAGRRQVPGPDEAAEQAQPYGSAIPELTGALGGSPYFIGKQLIDVLVGEGGNAAVDAAFRDPPRTTEHILDPRAYLARDRPREVTSASEVLPKSNVQDQMSLGALNLYLVLAAGIDPVMALDAATGWGGEAVVSFDDPEGRSCVELTVVGDTEEDTAEIGEAFTAWADSGLADHASSTSRSGAQVLTACEIGAGAASTDPFDALILAEVRGAQVWAAQRDAGLPAGEAFAYASCVVHTVPLDELLAEPSADGLPPGTESALEEAAATC